MSDNLVTATEDNLHGGRTVVIDNYNNYYYHGSPVQLSIVNPQPSPLFGNTPVVFATNTRWLGIFFSSYASDADIEVGFIDGRPYMMELHRHAFDYFLKNKVGYLLLLNKYNFHSSNKVKYRGHEFISKQVEAVHGIEVIPDIYRELRRSEVTMITFDEKILCIDSLISVKSR